MSEHTKEPWSFRRNEHAPRDTRILGMDSVVTGGTFERVIALLQTGAYTEANARRIVACVNACEGLSTEALESGALRKVIETYQDTRVFPPRASQLALLEAFKKLEGNDD